jgi:hypothetical protein
VVGADELLDSAADVARSPPPPLVRDLPFPSENAGDIFEDAHRRLAPDGYPSFTRYLLQAIEAGAQASTFDEGLARARELYDATIDASESNAARAAFFAKARKP